MWVHMVSAISTRVLYTLWNLPTKGGVRNTSRGSKKSLRKGPRIGTSNRV